MKLLSDKLLLFIIFYDLIFIIIYKSQQMPKVLQIFVVLSLILMIQAEDCEGNDC